MKILCLQFFPQCHNTFSKILEPRTDKVAISPSVGTICRCHCHWMFIDSSSRSSKNIQRHCRCLPEFAYLFGSSMSECIKSRQIGGHSEERVWALVVILTPSIRYFRFPLNNKANWHVNRKQLSNILKMEMKLKKFTLWRALWARVGQLVMGYIKYKKDKYL